MSFIFGKEEFQSILKKPNVLGFRVFAAEPSSPWQPTSRRLYCMGDSFCYSRVAVYSVCPPSPSFGRRSQFNFGARVAPQGQTIAFSKNIAD